MIPNAIRTMPPISEAGLPARFPMKQPPLMPTTTVNIVIRKIEIRMDSIPDRLRPDIDNEIPTARASMLSAKAASTILRNELSHRQSFVAYPQPKDDDDGF